MGQNNFSDVENVTCFESLPLWENISEVVKSESSPPSSQLSVCFLSAAAPNSKPGEKNQIAFLEIRTSSFIHLEPTWQQIFPPAGENVSFETFSERKWDFWSVLKAVTGLFSRHFNSQQESSETDPQEMVTNSWGNILKCPFYLQRNVYLVFFYIE